MRSAAIFGLTLTGCWRTIAARSCPLIFHAFTMKTWRRLVFVLGLFASLPTIAQTADSLRPIPGMAAKAEMVVVSDRVITLNGTSYKLSPGAVIRNAQNLIVLTQTLIGSTVYYVRVLLDGNSDVSQVWILTPGEQALDAPKLK